VKNYEDGIDEEKAIFLPTPSFRSGYNIQWKIYKRNSKIKMPNVLREIKDN